MFRTLVTLFSLALVAGLLWSCNALEAREAEPLKKTSAETTEQLPAEQDEDETPHSAYELATLVTLKKRQPLESEGLHNVFVLSRAIISGSEPHGEAAFQRLRELGVRTVISVDGKVPDVEMAKKYGMTYVHIPIQYKGIHHEALLRLAKSFRELKAPFYVHCFHGRHRGPAAAAVGRILLDQVSRQEAIAEMRQWFGTSSKYEGLYEQIARGPMPSADESRNLEWDFESAHPVKGIAGAMVPISRSHDALKKLVRRKWQVDPAHPDIDPVNEAIILKQSFERMLKMDEITGGPADQRAGIQHSVDLSRQLHSHLVRLKAGDSSAAGEATRTMKALKKECASCHKTYRNE